MQFIAQNHYGRDNAAYIEWDKVSADRETFRTWMEEHVLKQRPEVFKDRVAHLQAKG